jgi:transposase
MAYNLLRAARDQPFLLPPDLRDWLPEGHLAWFILDVVDQLDLQRFYLADRDDGHGRPAYDPKLLLGVLLYGYCLGVRSSRQIQRRCQEDIAFRVLAANQTPDHVTIARFGVRHQSALVGFLVASLKLCAAAGMVCVGTVALEAPSWPATPLTRPTAPSRSSKKRSPRSCARPRRCWRPRRPRAGSGTSSGTSSGWQRPPPLPAPKASHRGSLSRGRVTRRPTQGDRQTADIADPDSRFLRTRNGSVQGDNAQAVTTGEQVDRRGRVDPGC